MLKTTTIKSGVKEKEEYYSEDESLGESQTEQDEYYSQSETQSETQKLTQAVWHGQGAKKLGLEGNVSKSDFKDLFYGSKPGGTERIRGEKPNPEDRERLAHDLTFSAPKSVSMALHLGGELRIFDAHTEAVKECLDEAERRYAVSRIQVDGNRQIVNTDNLIIALIPHHTSRDGDLQLHTHAVVMNGTQAADGVWRALHSDAMSLQGWLGDLYRQKLAHKVQALGYSVCETKDGFELKGISRDDIEVFSKRSRSIIEKIKDSGLEVTSENRDWATLNTRKSKQITKTLEAYQQGWQVEAENIGISMPLPGKSPVTRLGKNSALDELDSASAHLSQRSVSFSQENIYQYVFKRLQSFELAELDSQIRQHSSLIRVNGGRFTTAAALEREIETLQRWMQGQGTAQALIAAPKLEGTTVNSGQAAAISRVLTSCDKHQIIHGLAGVGKTKALGELKRQLAATAIQIKGFSPTITATAALKSELGIDTNTVESLVLSQPDSSPNQLWIIDEAGMVSARQMLQIQRQADATGARILLVGDKGQNSSVEAGSPLRSLMEHGATTHSISQIIRQQNSVQKQAVELIANGKGSTALELLTQNGYVTEIASRSERVQTIAAQYLALPPPEQQQTMIVTGTNTERLAINQVVRAGQKQQGILGKDQIAVVQLVSRSFTHEQARRIDNYQVGNYIRLHRQYQGTSLQKGQLYKVEKIDGDTLVVSSYGGRIYRFDPGVHKDKEVFSTRSIEIATGEQLRWTATDRSKDQINGQTFTVTAIGETAIKIADNKGGTRDVSLRQPLAVDYDLVSTSYRAQAKTAKRVIVSATSDPTSSREPFYVKISRQTKELSVYTQDLQQLEKWVKRSRPQSNPLELLGDDDVEQAPDRSFHASRYLTAVEPEGKTAESVQQQVQPSRADERGQLERLAAAIQQQQSYQLIEPSLLKLKDAFDKASSIRPVETQPLVELAQTLEKSMLKHQIKAAQTIQNEKLKILAEAIAQWRADSAFSKTRQLQSLARGINAFNAERAATEVLKTQQLAASVNQIRAEDYIYAALHKFNQALNQGMGALKTTSQRLDAKLDALHSAVKQAATTKNNSAIAPASTPPPCQLEVCWQPGPAPEPPSNIAPHHWREWVADSCIHPAIAAARLETISGSTVYERLLADKLATMGSGQYVTQPMARLIKAYEQLAEAGGWWVEAGVDPCCFPTLEPGARPKSSLYGTFKPNNPRLDDEGKIRKYENPLSLKQNLFERSLNFSTVPDEIAEQIYRKYGIAPTVAEKASGFWYVVYKYPEIPIYRAEGNKKDAAIASQGRVVISGQGVNAGYRAKDQFGNKLARRVLHPQLEIFTQPGREFRFALDQDSKLSTILNVRQDLVREAELLTERGCNVSVLQWDSELGKGADDLIKNHGSVAFERADARVVGFEQIAQAHYRTKYNSIAQRVRAELGEISPERLDLEVYLRASAAGDNWDGNRFVGESDTARLFRQQQPAIAAHYVRAISLVANTYQSLSQKNVENLDELIATAVKRQTVARALKDDLNLALDSSQLRKPQFRRRL